MTWTSENSENIVILLFFEFLAWSLTFSYVDSLSWVIESLPKSTLNTISDSFSRMSWFCVLIGALSLYKGGEFSCFNSSPGGTEFISFEEALVPSSGEFCFNKGGELVAEPGSPLYFSDSNVKLSRDYLLSLLKPIFPEFVLLERFVLLIDHLS